MKKLKNVQKDNIVFCHFRWRQSWRSLRYGGNTKTRNTISLYLIRPSLDILQVCVFHVCCGCDTSYIHVVSVHIQCPASIYALSLCRGHSWWVRLAKQEINAGSSRAPGLTSGLPGSVNVHHGALLLVPQWQCISSFVFYVCGIQSENAVLWSLHV